MQGSLLALAQQTLADVLHYVHVSVGDLLVLLFWVFEQVGLHGGLLEQAF